MQKQLKGKGGVSTDRKSYTYTHTQHLRNTLNIQNSDTKGGRKNSSRRGASWLAQSIEQRGSSSSNKAEESWKSGRSCSSRKVKRKVTRKKWQQKKENADDRHRPKT